MSCSAPLAQLSTFNGLRNWITKITIQLGTLSNSLFFLLVALEDKWLLVSSTTVHLLLLKHSNIIEIYSSLETLFLAICLRPRILWTGLSVLRCINISVRYQAFSNTRIFRTTFLKIMLALKWVTLREIVFRLCFRLAVILQKLFRIVLWNAILISAA